MLALATLAAVAALASARHEASCAPPGAQPVLVRALASPPGRVQVRYCAAADARVSLWQLVLSGVQAPRQACSYRRLGEQRAGTMHSFSEEPVHLTLNCSTVCFSRALDLVYRGCYRLQNKLQRGAVSAETHNSYYYADNNVTGPDYYTNTSQLYKDFDNDDGVVVRWYQSAVPIEEFEVELQRIDSPQEEEAMDVSANCSRDLRGESLRCAWRVPRGCYEARLRHTAPWASHHALAALASAHATFCHGDAEPAVAGAAGAGGAGAWAGGALLAALLLGGLLVLALLWRARTARRRTLKTPTPIRGTSSVMVPACGSVEEEKVPLRVLVLYARECQAGARAARALTDLLDAVAPGQVYDLYSASSVALSARAPGEWLRALMTSAGTRVVLLQTPALACLHRAALDQHDAAPRLRAPLLGAGGENGSSRALVYRCPSPGDALLALALRLLAEGPPAERPYHTYYLATLEALPTETLPHVVPFRRYELPAAARRLLLDLAAPNTLANTQLIEAKEAALAAAVAALVQYVRDHDNYLADELMFL